MPLYLTEYGYFASRSPGAARQDAHALPAAGLLDRTEELPRQEPAAVPAGVAARELELGLLQPRAALDAREEVPAVRRPAALVQGEPREGEAARRGNRPPGRAAQPGSVSARLADARERLLASPSVPGGRGRGGAGAGARAARRGRHGPAARQARGRRDAPARRRSLPGALHRARRAVLGQRPSGPGEGGGGRRRARRPGRRARRRGPRAGRPGSADRAVDPLAAAVRRRAGVGGGPAQRRPGLGDAHQGRAPGGRAGLRALRGREWCERAMVRDRRDRRG